MTFRGRGPIVAAPSCFQRSPSRTKQSISTHRCGIGPSTHPDPFLPLLWDMIENDVAFVVLEDGKLPLDGNAGSVHTLRTLTISFTSTAFASFFMSTLSPSSFSTSPMSSFWIELSTPAPPILPNRPQNSTKAFSPIISSNAFRASVFLSRCHLSNSCSVSRLLKPSFVAGSEESNESKGSAENVVARVGVCDSNKAWRL